MSGTRYFFFDCETTGLPRVRYFSEEVAEDWPRLVQIAWAGYDSEGNAEIAQCHIIRPDDFEIPEEATRIHGITDAMARLSGRDLPDVLDEFLDAAGHPGTVLVAHNLDYDLGVVGSELVRQKRPLDFVHIPGICTMKTTTDFCRIPRMGGGFGFKWPSLTELHLRIFGLPYDGAHDAGRDIEACARCFFKLLEGRYYPQP
jgi:DNA polymerase III subunit epsilon